MPTGTGSAKVKASASPPVGGSQQALLHLRLFLQAPATIAIKLVLRSAKVSGKLVIVRDVRRLILLAIPAARPTFPPCGLCKANHRAPFSALFTPWTTPGGSISFSRSTTPPPTPIFVHKDAPKLHALMELEHVAHGVHRAVLHLRLKEVGPLRPSLKQNTVSSSPKRATSTPRIGAPNGSAEASLAS